MSGNVDDGIADADARTGTTADEGRNETTSDAFSVRMRASAGDEHVSGAETIIAHDEADETTGTDAVSDKVASAAESMVQRALEHPRGNPDDVTVTVERLSRPPRCVEALPVVTLDVDDADESREVARELLARADITDGAVTRGFDVLRSDTAERGAGLVDAADGSRLDPIPARGVRATNIGTSDAGRDALDVVITKQEVASPETVREAVVLATTIAHAPGTRAELCWSDDPDYAAGYVATPEAYYRFPVLKPDGVTEGGRAIFVAPGAPVVKVVDYLETQPVLVGGASGGETVEPAALFGDENG
ncbi:6-carboxyhexanoate--CoA ligase [Halopenitus sp. H-Gu1]|uniref:6-carboxyhexanoate--CoA ligase n=1 Tax=Halopenitus sp. H-Gu1 TaxID=3242697 RepID=UPI00359DD9C6